jgi:hypothetical protein
LSTESQYDFVMRTHDAHFRRRRKDLSGLSGVSLDTLNKIFQRQTKNPKASTVQAIYDVLVVRDRDAGSAPIQEPEEAMQSRSLDPACI